MIKPRQRLSRPVLGLIVAGFLAVGYAGVWWFAGRAAGTVVPLDVEKATISGSASVISDSATSGGLAIKFGDAGVKASHLPFDLPPQSVLKASNKLVFSHYFPPYPISKDNKPSTIDYFELNYIAPTGEAGKYLAIGGLVRERPMPRAVDPDSANYLFNDMKTEVLRASNAGLDGFAADILGTEGSPNWDRIKILMKAAPVADPNFKIMIRPSCTEAGVESGVVAFAASIASLAKDPVYNKSLYKLPDGRLVISPFAPDIQGAQWWSDWMAEMKNVHGIDVAFFPSLLNASTANKDAFAPISIGLGNWGKRNPAGNQNLSANIIDVHNRGKMWMQPVITMDTRPKDSIYDEAYNTENLRLMWSAAINHGADWVDHVTWNDYSEHTEFSPSTHIGWGPLNISSYYITWFKTGTPPPIVRDVLYLSHRIQPYAALPTGGQTSLMQLRSGSSPPRDTVEVLSFLTAPASVTVKVGGNTYTYDAPAGLFAKTYPLAIGNVSATAVRGGTSAAEVLSPFPVVAAPVVQDLNYYFSISGRQ
jgi:hypothetical protein